MTLPLSVLDLVPISEGVSSTETLRQSLDLAKAVDLVQRIAKEIDAKSVAVTEAIAKVSLVGVGMRSHSGVAAKMFEVLSREGINIMMISTSEIKISCVVEEKYMELAMRALHSAFGLDAARVGA